MPPSNDFGLGNYLDSVIPGLPSATAVALEEGVRCFSGADIKVYIHIPFVKKHNLLGSLKLISWGTQRNKSMVTALGRADGVGFTRGARVVTGVLQFLQLDRSAFTPLTNQDFKNSKNHPYKHTSLADELPPFDLLLAYVSEDGSVSYQEIGHVEIVASQGTNSTDDPNPVEVYSFVALHITPLLPLSMIRQRFKEPVFTDSLVVSSVTPWGISALTTKSYVHQNSVPAPQLRNATVLVNSPLSPHLVIPPEG